MTDTHTHLYMEQYAGEETQAVERALAAGVSRLIFPGVDMASIEAVRRLHEQFPDSTFMAIGLHPTELGERWREDISRIAEILEQKHDYCAIGEVGMDLYHDKSMEREQREAFAMQLHIAARHGLPVLIHCREALTQTLEVIAGVKNELERENKEMPLLVFHSFTGTADDVREIRRVCDPMFGINGVVTFKNAPGLREALPEIGLERIVLETDAPYLAPVPHRGKRNESSYIPLILQCVASTLGESPERVEEITDRNAMSVWANSTSSRQDRG